MSLLASLSLLLCASLVGSRSPDVQALAATDRAGQAAAMESIVATCEGCERDLIELWQTTKRSDVRKRVAEALSRLRAIDALLELASRENWVGWPESLDFVMHALAECGPAATDAIVARVEAQTDTDLAGFLPALWAATGQDQRALSRRLLLSDDDRVRETMAFYLRSGFPAHLRYELARLALEDSNEHVRSSAYWAVRSRWPLLARMEAADAYARFRADMVSWLESDDPDRVKTGLESLGRHAPVPKSAEASLEKLMADEGLGAYRWNAMRLYVAIDRSRERQRFAIDAVSHWLEEAPSKVAEVLHSVDPDLISDDILGRVVLLLSEDDHDSHRAASRLLLDSDEPLQEPLARRALPLLIQALDESAGDAALNVATTLMWYGPAGRSAAERWLNGQEGEQLRRGQAILNRQDEPEEAPTIMSRLIHEVVSGEEDAAKALAAALLANPEEIDATIGRLVDDPEALIAVLTTPIQHGGEEEFVRLSQNAEPSLIEAALDVLLAALDDPEMDAFAVISQLGKLNSDDERRADALVHLSLFGEEARPELALMNLAQLQPADSRVVPIMAEWFDGRLTLSRSSMVVAVWIAMSSAVLGEEARPLIDEFLQLGETAMRPHLFHHDYALLLSHAMREIDATDPRVIAFGDRVDAKRARLIHWLETDAD